MKSALLFWSLFFPLVLLAQPRIDEHPVYRPNSPVHIIEKIEYTDKSTIIYFSSTHYGARFYGTEDQTNCWVLKDNKGKIYKLKSVEKVTLNGSLVAPKVSQTLLLNSKTDERAKFSCQIHFPKLDKNVKKIDLIEGLANVKKVTAFNAFDIKVKTVEEIRKDPKKRTPLPIAISTLPTRY